MCACAHTFKPRSQISAARFFRITLGKSAQNAVCHHKRIISPHSGVKFGSWVSPLNAVVHVIFYVKTHTIYFKNCLLEFLTENIRRKTFTWLKVKSKLIFILVVWGGRIRKLDWIG